MIRKPILALCALALFAPASVFAAKAEKAGKAERQEKRAAMKAVQEYDKNTDGKIDGDERDAVRKAFEADKTGSLKAYDTNKDGALDDNEIGAIVAKHHEKGEKKKKNQ